MDPKPPDVVLVSPEWGERALLRAQLIEEGHKVVALDAWPIPWAYRRPGMKPRALVIDLHGLPNPQETLEEARFVIPAERVLVITAIGTLAADEIRRMRFAVLERPVTIGQIAAATAELVRRTLP